MAQTAEDLLVRIDATTEQLRREMRRADESIARFDKNVGARLQRVDQKFQRLNQRMERVTQSVRTFAAAFAGVQLVRFGDNALKTAESIDRVSRSLNVSRQRIQELQFTFARFGLQQKDVNDALATLADRAQDAIDGTKSIREDFQAIGISVDELRGKSPAQLFDRVARAIANTEDPTKRSAAAVRILEDEMGQKLLPLLTQGEAGLKRFAEQAQRAGVVMSDSLIRQSTRVAEQMDVMRLAIQRGFQRGFLQGIVDEFGDINEAIVESGRVARQAGEAIGEAGRRAAQGLQILSENAETTRRVLGALVALKVTSGFRNPWIRAAAAVAGFFNKELMGAARAVYDALQGLIDLAKRAVREIDSALASAGRAIADQMEKTIDRQEQAAKRFFRINAELFNPNVQQNGRLYGELIIGGAEAADAMEGVEQQAKATSVEINQFSGTVATAEQIMADAQMAADLLAGRIQFAGEAAGDAANRTQKLNVDYADLRKRMQAVNPAIEAHKRVLDGSSDSAKDVEDATQDAERATRDLGIQTRSTADIMRGAFEEVGRSIQSGIRDALLGAEQNLLQTAKRIAADIAAAFATQRIIIPAVVQPVAGALGLSGSGSGGGGGAGGTGQVAQQTAGGLNSLSSLSSAGSVLSKLGSLGKPVADVGRFLFGSGAQLGIPSGGGPAINAGGGLLGSSATLRAAANLAATPAALGGGLIGGLAGKYLFRGGDPRVRAGLSAVGSIGGSVAGGALAAGGSISAAAAGAAAGSVVPIIGTAIGGFVGALGGSFLGSLFGGDKDIPARMAGREIGLRNGEFQKTGGFNREASKKQKQAFNDLSDGLSQGLNQIRQTIEQVGGDLNDFPSFRISVGRQRGVVAAVEDFTAGTVQARKAQPGLPSFNGNLNEASAFALAGGFQRSDLAGLNQQTRRNIRSVTSFGVDVDGSAESVDKLANRIKKLDVSAQEVLERVNFAATFERRTEALRKGAQDFSEIIEGQVTQRIEALTKTFQEFRTRTRELNLDAEQADQAVTGFVKRLVGIVESRDVQSQTQRELLRIQSLRDNIDPLVDQTSLTRLSVDRALLRRRRETVGLRNLQLEAGLQSQPVQQAAGQITQFLTQQLPTLRSEFEQSIIRGDIRDKLVEQGFQEPISNLNLEQLRNLRSLFQDYSEVIPDAGKAISQLTDRIQELANASFKASSGLSTQVQRGIRGQFAELFGLSGPKRFAAQITSLDLEGTAVARELNRNRAAIGNQAVSPELGSRIAQRVLNVAGTQEAATKGLQLLSNAIREVGDAANDNSRQLKELQSELDQRKDNARQFFAGLVNPLQDFQNRLAFGGQAQQAPGAQLEAARAQFQDVLQNARAGELAAIRELPNIGDQVVRLSREVFASGPRGAEIISGVRDGVSDVLGNVESRRDSLFAEFSIRLNDSIETQTSTLQEELQAVREELRQLRRAQEKQAKEAA
ncbi:MAG: hypothetical protein U5L06_00660 [Rhodovibrio sp.]|nr:hypothetical protein [Rhodovibrio sp.]